MFVIPDFSFAIVPVHITPGSKIVELAITVNGLNGTDRAEENSCLSAAILDDERFIELNEMDPDDQITNVLIHQTIAGRLSQLIHLGYLKSSGWDNLEWTFLNKQYEKDILKKNRETHMAKKSVMLD